MLYTYIHVRTQYSVDPSQFQIDLPFGILGQMIISGQPFFLISRIKDPFLGKKAKTSHQAFLIFCFYFFGIFLPEKGSLIF